MQHTEQCNVSERKRKSYSFYIASLRLHFFPCMTLVICCTCTLLPSACIGWILWTTTLWGLSQAAKLLLTIAPYMAEFSGLHWPCTDSLTATYLFISPSLLCSSLIFKAVSHSINYCLRSNDTLLLSVPEVGTEFGKQAFMFSAPTAWNRSQLEELIPITLENVVKGLEANSVGICNCFLSWSLFLLSVFLGIWLCDFMNF